jgi:MinD-like ATPase involved in chromosome partitioning or flagellar assembly
MSTIYAQTERDGSALISVDDGPKQKIKGTDLGNVRQKVMDFAMQRAQRTGETHLFVSADPEGNFRLLVHPDGRREVAPDQAENTTAPATPVQPPVTEQPAPPLANEPQSFAAPPVSWPAAPADNPPPANRWLSGARRSDQNTPTPAAPSTPRRTVLAASESFLTVHQAKQLAETSWRGWLNRTFGLKLTPAARESEERAALAALCQPWDGPRTIVVLNPKGGAAKTPITILLAALFGTYGDGSVLAWDNNDTRGSLGWRTQQSPLGHTAHVRDLLPHTERLMTTGARSGDLNAFVHRQGEDRYDVLRSAPEMLPNQGRLTAENFDAVHQVATKYYRLIFVDTGNEETAPHWLRAIDKADQIVVATTGRSDRAEAARLMLNSLRARDQRSHQLADNAVVFVSQAYRSEPDPQVIAEKFEQHAKAAYPIRYDPAIGADWLHLKALRRSTRLAILRGAKAVADGL